MPLSDFCTAIVWQLITYKIQTAISFLYAGMCMKRRQLTVQITFFALESLDLIHIIVPLSIRSWFEIIITT